MTTSSPAPAGSLADRYGAPRRTRRLLVVGGVVLLAVVGLAWVAWVSLFHGRPAVTSELVGFDVAGQHTAVAEYTVVRRDADVEATCLLRAFAADHAVVGELTVPVDRTATASTTATLTSDVRTEREATAVELVGCTAPGQKQAR